MREIERILDQLNRAWGGPSWTGVDIGPVLEGVTDPQARAHPIPNAHSIIELVAHSSTWMDEVAHRLAGSAAAGHREHHRRANGVQLDRGDRVGGRIG